MKSKSTVLILAIAATSVAVAVFALSRGAGSDEIDRTGAPLLAELEPRSASLDRIELERGATRLELRRAGDGWTLASSDGYPARFEQVKALVSGLASLRLEQKMTALPDRHGDLGVAWPDAAGRAARVRLFEKDAATPAFDVVLGEERASPRAQFVRRGEEAQSWRVLGSVPVDIEVRRWVEAELLSIPDGEVRGVRIDGLRIDSTEETGGRLSFAGTVEPAPAAGSGFVWSEARIAAAVRSLPSWLARLELDDVRRAKGGTPDPTISPEFDMVRGTLKVRAVRDGDAIWIAFEATPKEGAPDATEINAKYKYAGDPLIPDWKAFATKHAGWEYRLPGWKQSALEEASKQPAEDAPAGDPTAPTAIPSAG